MGGEEPEAGASRQETPVFEKFNPLLHGGVTTTSGKGASKRKEVLSIGFVKKYIQYSKNRIKPVLTKPAADWIVNVYSSLRNDDMAANQKRVRLLTREGSTDAMRRLPRSRPVRSRRSSVSRPRTPRRVSPPRSTRRTPARPRRSSGSRCSRRSSRLLPSPSDGSSTPARRSPRAARRRRRTRRKS